MIILKILLIILLSLLALVILISCLKLHIRLVYNQKPELSIRVLFIRYKVNLSDDEKKSDKEESSDKKKKSKKAKKSKKSIKPKEKNFFKKAYRTGGVSGFLELISELYRLVSSTLKPALNSISVDKFAIELVFAGKDAADTAIGYGKCCSVVYPFTGLLFQNAKCKKYDVFIAPDFRENAETRINADISAGIRIYRFVFALIKFLLGFIKITADKPKGE